MRKVVFDIETQNFFDELGTTNPASLDIAVVGIYDSERDVFESYEVADLPKLWPILDRTDLLIGFNSLNFDLPLLNKYYAGDLSHIGHLDIFVKVKEVLGRRIKLDTLAQATLGCRKIADGLQALRWWREGKKEKVKEYCLEDVRLTKELYEYILRHGSVKYRDGNEIKDLRIDTSQWNKENRHSLTHSLPFSQ